jgi:hypothetical protein
VSTQKESAARSAFFQSWVRHYTQKTSGKKPVDVKKSITEIRVFAINKLDRPAKGEAEGAVA